MTTHSALYEGKVRHRRFGPVGHEFTHRIVLAYLDLDELAPGGPLAALSRRRLVRFERSDYLGDPALPLDEAVRDVVESSTGRRPAGPVRALTQLRSAGWNFNPITLYYCFAAGGDTVEAVLFEVTNTPWGERHAYVLEPDADGSFERRRVPKALHVSPFLPMELDYRVSCPEPAERVEVHFDVLDGEVAVFDADLRLRRRASLDRRGLIHLSLAHPAMPMRVSLRIYLEALRLACKRAPIYRHPGRGRGVRPEEPTRKVA